MESDVRRQPAAPFLSPGRSDAGGTAVDAMCALRLGGRSDHLVGVADEFRGDCREVVGERPGSEGKRSNPPLRGF